MATLEFSLSETHYLIVADSSLLLLIRNKKMRLSREYH